MKLVSIFSTGMNSIFPIMLLILFGFALRQKGFLSDEFVRIGNKLSFQYLLPIKMFLNAYKIEKFSHIPWRLVLFSLVMMVVIFALGCFTAPLATKDPRRKGVLLQSTFRSNTAIIGISLAGILGGEQAATVSSILTAMCLPLMNILAVVSLSMFIRREGKRKSLKQLLRDVVTNPLIVGIVLGFGCVLIRNLEERCFGSVAFSLRENLPFVYSALSQLSSIASPFALVVLGGQFNFSAAGNMHREIIVGTVWRNVIAPILALGSAYLLSTHTGLLTCTPADYPALIALFATPVAVSSAVMASQMGGDGQLATQLVVWTSVASVVTMFAIICIVIWAGLLG